jgi:tetratricopeptide (TPR) repeat protein
MVTPTADMNSSDNNIDIQHASGLPQTVEDLKSNLNRVEESKEVSAPQPATGGMEEDLKLGKSLSDDAFRAFKQGNLDEAVVLFSDCLDLMVPHVGQMAEALGPIYLAYGRALMQVAIERQDQLLLNQKAVPEKVQEEPAEEQASTSAAVGKKRKLIDLPDIIPDVDAAVVDDEDDKGKEKMPNETVTESSDNEAEEAEEGAGEGDGEGEAEEEEDDFQIAWEILDVARLIYSKQDSPLAKQVTAEIHMDLGDLQMENEQFEQAISDYHQALAIHESMGDSSSQTRRAIASIYFKLALAFEYGNKQEDALNPLESALSLLTSCLNDCIDKIGSSSSAEVKELEGLVDEIKNRIADIQSSMAKSQLLKEKIVQDDGEAGFVQTLTDVPVNDLSGLVKKRKTAE